MTESSRPTSGSEGSALQSTTGNDQDHSAEASTSPQGTSATASSVGRSPSRKRRKVTHGRSSYLYPDEERGAGLVFWIGRRIFQQFGQPLAGSFCLWLLFMRLWRVRWNLELESFTQPDEMATILCIDWTGG